MPIVNFWFPKKIANDVWEASASRKDSFGSGRGVMNAWWALWVIGLLTSGAIFSIDLQAADVEAEFDDAQLEVGKAIVGDVAHAAAALFALLFVRQLTRRQLTTYAEGPVTPGAPAAGPYPGTPNVPVPASGGETARQSDPPGARSE